MNYTVINLKEVKRYIYNKTAGIKGESYVNGVKFIIPVEYSDWSVFVDIQNACGEKYKNEIISLDGTAVYEFTAIDLKQQGQLKLDLVLVNGKKIAKPFRGEFAVKDAICADNMNTEDIPVILTSEVVKSIEACLKEYHHENRDVLDKFSEDENGLLLYDGANIESSMNISGFEQYKEQIEKNTEARHSHANSSALASIDYNDITKLNQIDIVNKNGFYVNDIRMARANEIPIALETNYIVNKLNGSNAGTYYPQAYFTGNGFRILAEHIASKYATKDELKALNSPLRVELVDVLPTPESSEKGVIYLVPKSNIEQNIYDEYLFINGQPELIGSTQINLSDYAKSEDVYTKKEIDNKGFITVEDLPESGESIVEIDPTVPDWAKQVEKPSYRADEILYSNEKLNLGEDWNVKSAFDVIVDNVTDFFAEEYPELEEKVNNIPTKISQLDNDKNFVEEKEIQNKIDSALETAKESGDFNGRDGEDGQDGKDGLSAYQIWLNAGNTGTESDYLESLKGKDGVDGKNGTSVTHEWNGTILTVISENGVSSVDLKGETGNSGVYIGDGDMPEDCNVQINPNGSIVTVSDIAEEAAALINDSLLNAIGTGVIK